MTVGIIGSGNIGGTVARLAVAAGHTVIVANSNGPESLKDLVSRLGPKARAGTPAQAIAESDLVVVGIPFLNREKLFKSGVDFRGKIVVDAMNPFTPDFKIMDLGGLGSAEIVAAELPGARVVKAFNTFDYETLNSSAKPNGSPERVVLPLAGDDAEAKRSVASFIDSVGYDPLDVGNLVEGRKLEPGSAFNEPLTLAQAKAAAI
jgi:predicted dinucleotide-binding enzyme